MENILSDSPCDHPGWLEIAVDIDPIAHEAVSSFLFDLGCEGIVSEDFTPKPFIKAYLQIKQNPDDVRQKLDHFLLSLQEIFPEIENYSLSLNKIANRDWSLSWRKFFKPDHITQRLTVIPAWEKIPQKKTEHVIRIDPGPAFGTGQHASTRLCLEAMEIVDLENEWAMMDVGTGSGILAIYGVKLGARRVVGIDIDPEAIRWAERNIALNGLSKKIALSSRPLETWEDQFLMVTANLTRNVILELLPHLFRILAPGAWLILSGILKDQVNDIQKAFTEFRFQRTQVLYQEEWACIIGRMSKKICDAF
jgi:ribosomal protein L11 methyltransferase